MSNAIAEAAVVAAGKARSRCSVEPGGRLLRWSRDHRRTPGAREHRRSPATTQIFTMITRSMHYTPGGGQCTQKRHYPDSLTFGVKGTHPSVIRNYILEYPKVLAGFDVGVPQKLKIKYQ